MISLATHTIEKASTRNNKQQEHTCARVFLSMETPAASSETPHRHRGHDLRGRLRRFASKIFKDDAKKPAVVPPAEVLPPAPVAPAVARPALARRNTSVDVLPTTVAAPSAARSAAVAVLAATVESATSAANDVDDAQHEEHPNALKPRTLTSSISNSSNNSNSSNSNSLRRHLSAPIASDDAVFASASGNQAMPTRSSSVQSIPEHEQFDERAYVYDEELNDSDDTGDEFDENQNENHDTHPSMRRSASSSSANKPTNPIAMTLGLATAEGLTGHANEDRIVVESNESFRLLAVLDGHGGEWTADFVKDRLFSTIARCYDGGFDPKELADAIDALDAQVQSDATQLNDFSGACMVCVLLFVDAASGEAQTLTLNVGDCRAIMHEARARGKKANKGVGPNGRLYALSEDHCEANKAERLRVLASGAYIEYGRIGGVLEPFRSIGDIDMKEREMDGWVIATPEIKKTRLARGRSTLVIATDGVWGSLVNQKVMALARQFPNDPQAAADAIVTAAREAGSLDDIAVVVAQV